MTLMPSWRMPGSDGRTWTSAELKGTTYVMYFYPKDQTPGCTIQACDFRDHLGRLQAAGIKVFGVSPDSLASHHKFAAKEKLTFPLLTDNDHALATKLGVWAEKSLYGRTFPGIERTTFLIGPEGTIIGEWRKVKVAGHVAEVVSAATGLTVPPKPVPQVPPVAPVAPALAAKPIPAPVPAKPVVVERVADRPATPVKAPGRSDRAPASLKPAAPPAAASPKPLVKAKPPAKAKPETKAKAAPAKPVAKTKPAAKATSAAKAKPMAKAKPAAKAKSEAKSEAKPKPKRKG